MSGAAPRPLDPQKFRDPSVTARGERRARVALSGLRTLWINTGTLCNLTCRHCYIESSPRNDRLAYISAAEVSEYLDEIARDRHPTTEIGFTGGEPFMNPDLPAMLEDALGRGFSVLVLTNAMRPMRKLAGALLALRDRYGERLRLRVSLDHYAAPVHEAERGRRSFRPTVEGLAWLAREHFAVDVAGRLFSGEPESVVRAGYATLFSEIGVNIDAADPVRLMLFPEMDASRDVPEITEACWGILHRAPESVMCASSRMVVKRRGAERPAVLACTLLAYDERFELGATLAEASGPVALNHPHCASFCVLGGAACSR
jgi:Radical SAM superfamily/4Fe-4S single cluster domain